MIYRPVTSGVIYKLFSLKIIQLRYGILAFKNG